MKKYKRFLFSVVITGMLLIMIIRNRSILDSYEGLIGHAYPLYPKYVNISSNVQVIKNSMKVLLSSQMILQHGIKLQWITERMKRLSLSWEESRDKLLLYQNNLFINSKHILIFPGLLTEYSVHDSTDRGELIQWSDLIATLHMLGHVIVIALSREQLIQVTTKGTHYDLVFTDYMGLQGLHDTGLMGIVKCHIRLLDSFGTEAIYNFRTDNFQADPHGNMFSAWNFEDLRQFWTLYPHTPDNSFLGFVMEQPKDAPPHSKRKNQAVIYGKEGAYIFGYEHYLDVIGSIVELHATMNDHLSNLPAHVINHGVLSNEQFKSLLQESHLFIGLGFPYEGPEPLEALANGCVFIQPKFLIPHNKHNTAFLFSKPTDRDVTSQIPYLENHVGEPYVYTVDTTNTELLTETIKNALKYANFSSYVPYEFTQEGMLERVGLYIQHQDFCQTNDIALKKMAWASSAQTSPSGAVDGMDTSSTCFRSKSPIGPHWWMLDLGTTVDVETIKIIVAYDWLDAQQFGIIAVPFRVALLGSHGNQITSYIFKDQRLIYYWERVKHRGKYLRIDTLEKSHHGTLILCSVGVYPSVKSVWPHTSLLHAVKSLGGQTCRDACMKKGLICEPEYFSLINNEASMNNVFSCLITITIEYSYLPFLPAYAIKFDRDHHIESGVCAINGDRLLLGCAGHHSSYQRLCPCRPYIKGQIAVPPAVSS